MAAVINIESVTREKISISKAFVGNAKVKLPAKCKMKGMKNARRITTNHKRVSPTSKTSYSTAEERTVRLKKANNKRRAISKAEMRLRKKFELKNQQHKLSEGMAKQYKIAMEAALSTNRAALHDTLKELLFKAMQKEAKSGKKEYELDMEQCQDFISFVEESMKNMCKCGQRL